VAAEALVKRYARERGFEYVIVRPSTVYGPGNDRMKALIRRVLAQRWLGHGPAGAVAMQPIHAGDLVAMLVLAGNHPQAANDIFNTAGTEVFTYRNLAQRIRRLGGMEDA
jgi:nucleoside-diphosphate-sugar epimerase